MGLQQSKDELLYQQVSYGNSEGIKSLRSEGAGLEWMDKEGKTPLILASMNPQLYDVAKTLIELGANVNAYRPANALVMNNDCQTALDVARLKGYSNVVRAIENHICLFSGWLQELYGPGFLELLAPQLLSRKVWVVILPCGAHKPTKPFKLELVIYSGLQDAKPRTIIALWKSNMDEPNFNLPDPSVIISSTNKSRVKLAPVSINEKEKLQRFCNACKGIPQVMNPAFPFNDQGYVGAPPDLTTTLEDDGLDLAIRASLQDSSQATPAAPTIHPASASTTPTQTTTHTKKSQYEIHDVASTSNNPITYSQVVPSAPPIPDTVDEGPIHYPSIDFISDHIEEITTGAKEGEKEKNNTDSSSCVICLDAPVEGACIPCGHMAGCMSCLNEIKGKNWGCPVCRTKIDQVVRLYAV